MRENKYTGTRKERRNRTRALMRSLSKQGSRSITDETKHVPQISYLFFIYFKYFYLSYIRVRL